MKKICSALLAFAMILSLSVNITLAASITSMTFTDTVSVTDDNVDIPEITISYTVANGTATTLADGTVVYAGIEADKVVLNASTHATTGYSGTPRSQSVTATVNFAAVTFTAPGVYRYTVTPSCSNSDVTVDSAKTIDVYVVNGEAGLEIAAYVMYDGNGNKVDEFEHTYTKETYTLTVTNTVTGNQGDKNKDFEYTLTIEGGNTLTAEITKADGTKETVTLTADNGTSTATFTLKDGESLVVTGLCANDKVTVTQTDESADGYTTTVSVDGATATEGLTSDELTISANTTIDFTNTKNITTPTGIVLSIAPYIAMIGLAGIFFVLVASRRRESEEL